MNDREPQSSERSLLDHDLVRRISRQAQEARREQQRQSFEQVMEPDTVNRFRGLYGQNTAEPDDPEDEPEETPELLDIYDLGLHDEITRGQLTIIRVPGGWIYRKPSAMTFVPFDNEFQQEEFHRPSNELPL